MDDLISRADVEQTVEDNILCYTHSDRPIDQDPDTECHMAIRTALRMLRKDLRKLPSAQPERKKGKWIDEGFYSDGHGAHAFRCSECGGHIIEYDADPFCKWCGADMRGEDDDIPDDIPIEYFESGGI